MFKTLSDQLIGIGVSPEVAAAITYGALAFGVLFLAVVANMIAKKVILRVLRRVIERSRTQWDDILLERKVFERISHIAPALVIYIAGKAAFEDMAGVVSVLEQGTLVYMIVVAILVVDALLDSAVVIYRGYEISKRVPIVGYLQVAKIAVKFLGFVFVIATIAERSPWNLLTGLGALTAVMMLVFKDLILGFVASIQLSTNDMVQRGDWIEMPKFGADGDVIDVTLATVKVQNWDKTIITIPTYALISNSFKNWRGMSESGGRRIKRSIAIDMNSVKYCDEEMLRRFKKIQHISEYVERKKKELAEHNVAQGVDESALINGRRLTNIGTFRAYVVAYLRNHPKIHKDMTFLVRHLASTAEGLPIEIYVFSNDQVWANYEDIQADIFDHILAAIPEFDLRVFQNPTGADFAKALGR